MHKQSKAEEMFQLGITLRRLIATMVDHHDPDLPFLFSKPDIKYGFWCIAVRNEDAWNFCYVPPSLTPVSSIDDIKIVVPNSLQMVWYEIPPFFCYSTETAREIILKWIDIGKPLPPHPFEHILIQQMQQHPTQPYSSTTFVTIIEVFVDNFIANTKNHNIDHLTHVSRCLLHGIHSIFPPPEVINHLGEDPISNKIYLKVMEHGILSNRF